MAEYIERDAVVETIKTGRYPDAEEDYEFETDRQWAVGFNSGLSRAVHDIICAPAADVAPVRHSRWIVLESYRDGGTAQRCSECRELMYFYRTTPRNHCPNCGAKMDGGGGDA